MIVPIFLRVILFIIVKIFIGVKIAENVEMLFFLMDVAILIILLHVNEVVIVIIQ